MAVIHPQDRIAQVTDNRAGNGKLHPCVGLIAGFGFIFGVATLVHVVFNMVL